MHVRAALFVLAAALLPTASSAPGLLVALDEAASDLAYDAEESLGGLGHRALAPLQNPATPEGPAAAPTGAPTEAPEAEPAAPAASAPPTQGSGEATPATGSPPASSPPPAQSAPTAPPSQPEEATSPDANEGEPAWAWALTWAAVGLGGILAIAAILFRATRSAPLALTLRACIVALAAAMGVALAYAEWSLAAFPHSFPWFVVAALAWTMLALAVGLALRIGEPERATSARASRRSVAG